MQKFIDGSPVWPAKGLNEVKDYGYSWEPEINDPDDQLASMTAVVAVGTVEAVRNGITTLGGGAKNQTGVVWLVGGAPGETCKIYMTGTTVKGREVEQTIAIQIKTK